MNCLLIELCTQTKALSSHDNLVNISLSVSVCLSLSSYYAFLWAKLVNIALPDEFVVLYIFFLLYLGFFNFNTFYFTLYIVFYCICHKYVEKNPVC